MRFKVEREMIDEMDLTDIPELQEDPIHEVPINHLDFRLDSEEEDDNGQ